MRAAAVLIALLGCLAGAAAVFDADLSSCGTVDVQVQLVAPGVGLLARDILDMVMTAKLRTPGVSEWSCVDGRSTAGILGTPAGDAGEFMLGLAVFAQMGGSLPDYESVRDKLWAHFLNLEPGTHFYMHTDSHTIESFEAAFLNTDVMAVPPASQAAALAFLTSPAGIGCGHLRLSLQHPDQYQVSPNVTQWFLRAFFDFAWNHENGSIPELHIEDYIVLQGSHTERAVITVYTDYSRAPYCAQLAPMVVPSQGNRSAFVAHPTFVSIPRQVISAEFGAWLGVPAMEVLANISDLAVVQMGFTLGYLAAGKPVYSAYAWLGNTTVDTSTCGILDVSVSLARAGVGMTVEDVFDMVTTNVSLTNPVDVPYFSCVDGRETRAILGTPAGDAGEFMLALATYAAQGGDLSSYQKVKDLLFAYIDFLQPHHVFYMHSDSHALEAFETALGVDVNHVPANMQAQAIALLTSPSYIGCGHMRLMLQNPGQYGVSSNVTAWFIQAFFDYAWNVENNTKVFLRTEGYVVLQGSHVERAVLAIDSDASRGPYCAALAPMVQPYQRTRSAFVAHPRHVGLSRSHLQTFFADKLPAWSNATYFLKQVNDLAGVQLGVTLGYLAPTIPYYDVKVFIGNVVADTSTCGVGDISVATVRGEPTGQTYQDVFTMLGTTTLVSIKDLPYASCVDGRATEPVLATPAGDAGEMLLAMAAYIQVGGNLSSYERVRDFAWGYFNELPLGHQFYMHTDEHSEALFDAAMPGLDVMNMPPANQSRALDLLTNTSFIGCGHIKQMILHPDEYHLTPDVTRNFIRAYFDYAWNVQAGLMIMKSHQHTVLAGSHNESAVLLVTADTSRAPYCKPLAPAVIPHQGQRSTFLAHPAFQSLVRQRLRDYLAEALTYLEVAPSTYSDTVDDLAATQLERTLHYLAPTLPIYSAKVWIVNKTVDISSCGILRVNLTTNAVATGVNMLTADEALQMAMTNTTLYPAANVPHSSCVDGRSTAPILGTPAGDAGEFMLAMASYISLGGVVSSYDIVRSLLFNYVAMLPNGHVFYMHTDSHSLDHFEGQFPGVDILDVPVSMQDAAWAAVIDPLNIGCGHLRNMVLHPDQYGVARQVTEWFIQAFFDYAWNMEDGEIMVLERGALTVLQGNHTERAVIQVVTDAASADYCSQLVPMVVPNQGPLSAFIAHPGFVSLVRSRLLDFFAPMLAVLDAPVSRATFQANVTALAGTQLTVTLGYLAVGRPIFTASITIGNATRDVSQCHVASVTVTQSRTGTGLSADDVQAMLNNDDQKRMVDPKTASWSCVDGRSTEPILGTPAGDAGEFLLALTAYVEIGGTLNCYEDVRDLFYSFLGSLPSKHRFYMHTDSHATDRFYAAYGDESADILGIPAENQTEAFNLLTTANYIGCGHLRLALQNPTEYNVPSQVTGWFLRAFFDFAWNEENGQMLTLKVGEYTVLQGNHTEKAVILVGATVDALAPECSAVAPSVRPLSSQSAFIAHPQWLGIVRQRAIDFFNPLLAKKGLSVSAFRASIDTNAATQLNATLAHLAPTLPIYSADLAIQGAYSTTTPTQAEAVANVVPAAPAAATKDYMLLYILVPFGGVILVIIIVVVVVTIQHRRRARLVHIEQGAKTTDIARAPSGMIEPPQKRAAGGAPVAATVAEPPTAATPNNTRPVVSLSRNAASASPAPAPAAASTPQRQQLPSLARTPAASPAEPVRTAPLPSISASPARASPASASASPARASPAAAAVVRAAPVPVSASKQSASRGGESSGSYESNSTELSDE